MRRRLRMGQQVALTRSYGAYMPGDVGTVVYVTWRGDPIVSFGSTDREEVSAKRKHVKPID